MSSITPFGQNGPYRDWHATEMTLFAIGGLMNIVGDINREPLKFGGSPALHVAGINSFTATMLAMHLAETAKRHTSLPHSSLIWAISWHHLSFRHANSLSKSNIRRPEPWHTLASQRSSQDLIAASNRLHCSGNTHTKWSVNSLTFPQQKSANYRRQGCYD